MKFKAEKKGSDVHFKLQEKYLDSNISGKLKAEFLILCTNDVINFFIDLEDVEFCDSSGLSALLITQRHVNKHDGSAHLLNCRESIIKLLRISQLDRVFVVEATNAN
jgi:anti-anti-sigma factor